MSSGEETIVVPCLRANPRISSDGLVPLLVTSNAAPSSIASRWASGLFPTTTTSLSAIRLGEATSMA